MIKILKLEQNTDYKNTAVIGGLESFADNWAADAHTQAKRPEHHQLIDELRSQMYQYPAMDTKAARHESVKYMIGRIMGRIPTPPNLPPSDYIPPVESAPPEPVEPEPETVDSHADDEAGSDSERAAAPEQTQYDTIAPVDEGVTAAPARVLDDAADVPRVLPATNPPRRPHRPALSEEEKAERQQALQAPITVLNKVGDKMAEKLSRLGITTINDMLVAFPRRYDDYTRMCTLSQLRPGEIATVIAAVHSVAKRQGQGGRSYLSVTVSDDTSLLQVTFFGQPWLQRQFKQGGQVVLSGKVELFRGQLMMTNPEWEMLERENLHTRRIVPVYPLTKGLSARTMRRLVRQTLDYAHKFIVDFMPQSVLDRANLADLSWAIQQIHFPESYDYLSHARTRLSFNELFVFQMGMMSKRREWQELPGQPLHVDDEWLASFLSSLPYQLTGTQNRALNDIRADMEREIPMNRLLQGDVGSGKTIVAAAALAMAAHHGKQAVLMAPTSILAEQHARSIRHIFSQWSGGEHVQIRLLTGNTTEPERQEIYAGLADGSVHIVIGTHAVIQESVTFHDLALAVIDEQHRFGVEQRGVLRGKGTNPHVLVMTATPIPRTLALTLYADLDLSIIDEMPPGRTPVQTGILTPVERERAYGFIQSQLEKERQAFIVYPLVEASEKSEELGAAVDEYERLKKQVFVHQRIGLLHGRLRPAEKDAIMSSFAAGEIDILVSTSVIEVGIDVPNASVILIENAERFGLAQLHQFRGRVGRGDHASFCLLLAGSTSAESKQRLAAMEDTTDGFKLAEIDWEMRGPGDLLGVRQSGMHQFRLAELMTPRLVELSQREARTLYAEDSHLVQPEHQDLAHQVQHMLTQRADVS
ncbi:MAG: ATP-dependent DNA helicase RecG [Anaerolineae bacterium]|nr:ATP-dependent DNA helicase RecG [Anaerolineae bacterium]